MDKARNIALKVLHSIDEKGAYSNLALDEEINKNREKLNEKDIGLISEIVYGTTTWKLTLDEIIKKYSKIRLKKISSWIKNILRMGIYQIIFLDKIPKSAAVNESVNLAKRYGHKTSSNFVNAILRKIEKRDYEEFFEIENDIERISLTTSMPKWIVEKLLQQENMEKVEEICKASNLKAKTSIRVNTLKINRNELIKQLEEETINTKVEKGILKDFIYINKIKNIENLKSFKAGLFTVQDEVAGLPSLILEPKENEKILDACSAPGGKTTYVAELMKNKGYIEAWDIHEHRTKLVEENAKRLGINIIHTKVEDATKMKEENKQFDKILLDVPCLGLGVIKRKPDIKWKKTEKDLEEIKKIQIEILETCCNYLKKGGTLVYSTCSILREENEDIVNKFLEKNKNFEIEKIKTDAFEQNNYFKKYISKQGNLCIYQDTKNDGFFIAKIRKK